MLDEPCSQLEAVRCRTWIRAGTMKSRRTGGNLASERELVASWSPQAKLCSLDTEPSAGAWLGMALRYIKSSWVAFPFLVLLFQVLLLVNLSLFMQFQGTN